MNPNPEQPDAPPFTTGEFHIKGGFIVANGMYIAAVQPAPGEARSNRWLHNGQLILTAFRSAGALHAAGWDAARVFERLPEVMRVLDHNCTGFAAQLKRDTAGGGR